MRKSRGASTGSGSDYSTLFGPAPLLEGEDHRAYDELLARVSDLAGEVLELKKKAKEG